MNIAKKLFLSLIALSMGVTPLVPAFAAFHAQLPQRQEDLQERSQNVQENLQQRQQNIQERSQEIRARLDERRKELIRRYFARMVKRFDAALERQKKLGERIQSRIDKARANDRDIVKAQTALDKAKAAWQEAKDALEAAKGKIEAVLGSDDPKAAFAEVRSLITKARDKIKAVHAAFVDAVTILKGLGGGEGRSTTATSTP